MSALVLAMLGALAALFLTLLVVTASRCDELHPHHEAIGLGAIGNFFDTLGMDFSAPTAACLKFRNLAPDSYLPAVLSTGHSLPIVTQALVFIYSIWVEPTLLIACIAATVIGASIGRPLAAAISMRYVQPIVAMGLVLAATLYVSMILDLLPSNEGNYGLAGAKFAIAVGSHLLLGALMSFGVGLYAPSLIALCLLGLNPAAALAVLMGARAFVMPIDGMRHIRSLRNDLSVAIGLTIGGIPAVVLAANLVGSLPTTTLRWAVVVVALYAAAQLIGRAERKI